MENNVIFIGLLVILVLFRIWVTVWFYYPRMVYTRENIDRGTIGMRRGDPILVRKARKARKSFFVSLVITVIVTISVAVVMYLTLNGKL